MPTTDQDVMKLAAVVREQTKTLVEANFALATRVLAIQQSVALGLVDALAPQAKNASA
jgi:hypothetical protein